MSGWTEVVCLCACLCVCVCKYFSLVLVSRTWASVIYIRFWISEFDDVMAAILHLSFAALSRS